MTIYCSPQHLCPQADRNDVTNTGWSWDQSINFWEAHNHFPTNPKVLPISELPTRIFAFCLLKTSPKVRSFDDHLWIFGWLSVDILMQWQQIYDDSWLFHINLPNRYPTSPVFSSPESSSASTFPNIRPSSIKSPMHFTKGELPGKISFATVESFRSRFQHLTGCFPLKNNRVVMCAWPVVREVLPTKPNYSLQGSLRTQGTIKGNPPKNYT